MLCYSILLFTVHNFEGIVIRISDNCYVDPLHKFKAFLIITTTAGSTIVQKLPIIIVL